MKIAIPVEAGRVSMHFGHCQQFEVYEVNETDHTIIGKAAHTPPPHEPGVLPRWLHELGANVIITGGMGPRAQWAHTKTVTAGSPTVVALSVSEFMVCGPSVQVVPCCRYPARASLPAPLISGSRPAPRRNSIVE